MAKTSGPGNTSESIYLVGEVPVLVCSSEGGAPQGMSPKLFLNLRRTHECGNLPLCKQLSFYLLASFLFGNKEMFPWECGNI
jgi:hypothetical protein